MECDLLFTDVNDCAAQPCQNGGSCQDLDGDYYCKCPSPYVGRHCHQREWTSVLLLLAICHVGTLSGNPFNRN